MNNKLELEQHQMWIANLIIEALKGKMPKTGIQKKHLNILVRWYPQINQKGADFYDSYMKAKKPRATQNARKELASCKNIRFSKSAFSQLKDSSQPDIYPEHNPPVAVLVDDLNSKIDWAAKDIIAHFKKEKYEVIILTQFECSNIPKSMKKKGRASERLIKAFCSDNINDFIEKKSKVEAYTNGA